jgi:hypothetical protein
MYRDGRPAAVSRSPRTVGDPGTIDTVISTYAHIDGIKVAPEPNSR